MFGTLLIGLREGLEAALVVGILLTYASRLGRRDVARRIWAGVGLAAGASLAIGAVLTFGAYGLSFQAQELIGGVLSIAAVGLVTWMVFWMLRVARSLRSEVEGRLDDAISGAGWGVTAVATLAVGREGLETALFVWSTTRADTDALAGFAGAVGGILAAAAIAWAITRGLMRLDLAAFFRWTGLALLVVAAGVFAYAFHDLQEAGVLPGPFAPAPDGSPALFAALFGPGAWAFQLSGVLAPDSPLAVVLKGTIGFSPDMTWLEVAAWAGYLAVTLPMFVRRAFVHRPPAARPAHPEPAHAKPAIRAVAHAN